MPSTPIPAPPPIDAANNVPSLRTLGFGAGQAMAGNDPRLSPASATDSGIVTSGPDPQVFGGPKTFNGQITAVAGMVPGGDLTTSLGDATHRFASLFGATLKDGGSVNRMLFVTGQGNVYVSGVADGGSAIAHLFNTNVSFANATAKLLSIQNSAVEKVYVDKAGTMGLAGGLELTNNSTVSIAPSGRVRWRANAGYPELSQDGRGWRRAFYEYNATEFGVVADDFTDNTAALQSAMDFAKTMIDAQIPVQITMPPGVCRVSSTIVMRGNSAMSPILVGSVPRGDNYSVAGASVIKWAGAPGGTLFFTEGTNVGLIRDIQFHGNSSAKRIFVYSATLFSDRSVLAASNDMLFERCHFMGCQISTEGAGCVELGTDPTLANGNTLEAATGTFRNCVFAGEDPGAPGFTYAGMKAFGAKNMSGGNAKIFRFEDCSWTWCRVPLDTIRGSAQVVVTNFQMADVINPFKHGSGELIVNGGDIEAGHVSDSVFLTGGNNQPGCIAIIKGVEFVSFMAGPIGTAIDFGGQLTIEGCYFRNGNDSENPGVMPNPFRLYIGGEYGANNFSSFTSKNNWWYGCGGLTDGYAPVYDNSSNQNPVFPTPHTYGALQGLQVSSEGDIGGAVEDASAGTLKDFNSRPQTFYSAKFNGPVAFNNFTGGNGGITLGTLTEDATFVTTAATGAAAINLPTAVGKEGRFHFLKKKNNTSAVLTVTPIGGETIDQASTYTMLAPQCSLMVVSDGANWYTIGGQFKKTDGDFVVTGQLGVGIDPPAYRFEVSGTAVGGALAAVQGGSLSSGDILLYLPGPTLSGNFNNWITGGANVTGSLGATMTNSNSTSLTADASWSIVTGGAGGGDPYIQLTISGVRAWSVGVDNSDGDRFKINSNGNPGAGGEDRFIIDPTNGSVSVGGAPNYKFEIGGPAVSGVMLGIDGNFMTAGQTGIFLNGPTGLTGSLQAMVLNGSVSGDLEMRLEQDNGVSGTANAKLNLSTAGASSGDPFALFTNGVSPWAVGLDNSDGDKFKISSSTVVGSNDALTIDPTSRLVTLIKGMEITTTSLAVSSSGASRLRMFNGRVQISENGGAFKLLRNVEVINPCDPKYGADPTGAADSLAAFQAALVDWYDAGRVMGRCLYIPTGDYKLSDTLVFPAVLGGIVMGDGRYSSRFVWAGPAGNDILVFTSSQHLTLQGFSIWGLASAKPRYAINFSYSSVVFAATGNTLRDILIDGVAARDVVTTGIFLDDAYGNNSEMDFYGVYINKFSDIGIKAPGSQQKALNFFGCGLNGAWDGVDHTLNGGQVGVQCGGSFQWYGGGVGACRTAAFQVTAPNDPTSIFGCQSELCYSFFGGNGSGAPLVNNANSTALTIQGCRIDTLCVPDPLGVIQFEGWGPVNIIGNQFSNGLGYQTYIHIASNGLLSGVCITGNAFETQDSVSFNPLISDSTVFNRASVWMRGNTFRDNSMNRVTRNEVLDEPFAGTVSTSNLAGFDLWYMDFTQFTANAGTQTISLRNVPKQFIFEDFRAAVYNYFTASGATVTMKVGTTSGGDELLKSQVISLDFINVSGDNSTCYGNGAAERGTKMQVGPFQPNYGGTTTIYVTLTLSAGTLGNGTVTNLGRGTIHFPVKYSIPPRFLV